MKKLLFVLTGVLLVNQLFAQAPEITRDEEGNKVVLGFLSKQQLATDTSFEWFIKNQQGYVPDQNALNALKTNRDSIYIVAFGGTWCGDTKFILPKLFALTDAAGIPADHITVIGVDHNKKTIQHLSETFNIINVPTIIIMKNGKELGRVIEYGKHGMFDREMGEIIRGMKIE